MTHVPALRRARKLALVGAALPVLAAAVLGTAALGSTSSASAATGSSAFPGGIATPAVSTAATQAKAYAASGDSSDAAVARTIAAHPTATWLTDGLSDDAVYSTVQTELASAKSQGRTAVFVTYAIPGRDCGSYSAGGLSPSAYQSWTGAIAAALRGSHAAVIVEPDALAQATTCAGVDADTRSAQIGGAVHTLAATGASVYIDAGHEGWVGASDMAARLRASDVAEARGFSLNVSNYYATGGEKAYGEQLHALTGKDYVIDTSRNGQGSNGQWCNDTAAGLGQSPTVVDDGTGLDALLWVKAPGESDGTCNGGPAAGQWFAGGAAQLVAKR